MEIGDNSYLDVVGSVCCSSVYPRCTHSYLILAIWPMRLPWEQGSISMLTSLCGSRKLTQRFLSPILPKIKTTIQPSPKSQYSKCNTKFGQI